LFNINVVEGTKLFLLVRKGKEVSMAKVPEDGFVKQKLKPGCCFKCGPMLVERKVI
jgi:hypothetical protein